LFQDDDSAFEAQVVTRPDGMRFYGVFNQLNQPSGTKYAMYAGGSLVDVPPPVEEPQPAALPVASGGCTVAGGRSGFDPTLWLLLAVALGAGARRRASARD
jgi:hypothetical protein